MEAKRKNSTLSPHKDNRTSVVSNLFLTIGTGIMITALIYMLVRLDKADSVIAVWTPFMVAGVWLSFGGGILIRLNKQK